jgi:hypothetical protein
MTCFLYFCAQTNTPGATNVTAIIMPAYMDAAETDKGNVKANDKTQRVSVKRTCTTCGATCNQSYTIRYYIKLPPYLKTVTHDREKSEQLHSE